VDGYNVIYGDDRYLSLRDEPDDRSLDHDVFFRAREALVGDVAAFAQGRYDATIVYDGAGNVDPERREFRRAGVRILFSHAGESADSVIEAMATQMRRAGQSVTVISSDLGIQSTIQGDGVTRISSRMLISNMGTMAEDVQRATDDSPVPRMTVADRLDDDTRAKLDALLGRRPHPHA
jgi:predicted RNA-binding protein with PIN domain